MLARQGRLNYASDEPSNTFSGIWRHSVSKRDPQLSDDNDGLAGEEEELTKSIERLDKASTTYSMEISAEKTKLMTNNTNGISTETKVNGQKLETFTSFRYLG